MSLANDEKVLEEVLGYWDRHNRVLQNLVRLLPPGGTEARAMEGSPSVSQMLTHLHHERMISVQEEAPEVGPAVPEREWMAETDVDRLVTLLDESAKAVRQAVSGRAKAGRDLEQNFTHPIGLILFLVFHEGYHHGQIKLALKAAGSPISDEAAGPVIWGAWRDRD